MKAPGTARHGAVAQLGERLNGIQEVDGSTPFSSTFLARVAGHGARLRAVGCTACVALTLLAALSGVGGCASAQAHHAVQQEDSLEAQPLPDDDSTADKVGEMGIVGLMVTGIVGGILLPIFLL